MIKELVTSTLLLAAPLNANVTANKTDNTYIQTAGQQVNQYTLDQDNNVIQGTYYTIKEFQKTLNMTYGVVHGKGFQYTYYDVATDTLQHETRYYFRYTENMQAPMVFENLKIYMNGNINYNTIYDIYFEDYYMYIDNTTNGTINHFLVTNTYTLNDLNTLRNLPMTSVNASDYVTMMESQCSIETDTNYKYIMIKIPWIIDGYDDISTVILQQVFNATNGIYQSVSTDLTWETTVSTTQEVIDLPGLMFSILGMPFAWISTAFNLTIFPGTMYEVNLAHVIMAIIGALILLFVIKKVMK